MTGGVGRVDFDLIIVGGGMVGASLACALGNTALRIAVIEAVPLQAPSQPSYDDRSIALAYGSKRIFTGMGLWSSLQAGVTAIKKIHVSDRGHFGMVHMDAADSACEALGYVAESRTLGRVFAARLAALDNVELLCPAELVALENDPDAVCVELLGPNGPQKLRTRLLVGADGGNSLVRRLAGIEVTRRDYGQSAVIANITPSHPHNNIAYERFTPTGPVALLPLSGRRCSLVWTVHRGQEDGLLALDEPTFLARLQAHFGYRLGMLEKVGCRRSYPLSLMMARPQGAPGRLALIGNAAHSLHPIAGQGFNLGIRDVAALAEVLNVAATQGQDIGTAAVLAQYQSWRQRDQRRVAALTDSLVHLFSNKLPPLVLARNLGLAVLDLLPSARRSLMRQTMGLTGRLPRLARGLPLSE